MWGQLIGGALKIGMGLYSGSQGSRAVGAATNIQAGQAGENADIAGQLPYRLNPYRQQSAEQWGQNVRGVYDEAGNLVMDTATQAGAGARGAAQRGNALLDPYNTAGGESTQSLLDLSRDLGGPQKEFQFSEDDPSYKWRLQQGQQALERSAAARGQLTGGGTMKALARYGQGAASQEYQAAFNRFMDTQKFGLDRSRLQADTLSGLAQRGLLAGTEMGRQGLHAEQLAGDWATRGAESAGRFRGAGAEFQSNTMLGANEQNIRDIYAGESARMGYMTDRARFLAGGQLGQEANQQAGLSQAAGGFNDLLYQPWGQPQSVGGQGMGTGGISPADEYYKSNPWYSPQAGPAPQVGGSSDSYWEDYWNDKAR